MNNEIIYKLLVYYDPYLLGYVFFTFFVQENDLLDRENIELMPIPRTSQGNSNDAAILASTENIDDDVEDEEEENSGDFLDEERMELLPIPSTSQGNNNTSTILKSTENDDDDDDDEDADNFTTQQLFSFAWQIAKGMVRSSI